MDNTNTTTFNTRMRELLQQQHISQKTLAEQTGITEAAICHYLKGDRMPGAATIAKIANALNTSVEYLMYGTKKESKEEISTIKELVLRNVQKMTVDEKVDIMRMLLTK